jgi:hypothetical protein
MKRKLFGIAGALTVLLMSGLVLAGCDNGTTSNGGGDGGNGTASNGGGDGGDVYTLEWGVCNITYEEVFQTITGQKWTYTKIGTASAAYGTKRDATSAYNYCVSNAVFEETGTAEGSFEDLVSTKVEGISAPSALKTSLLDQKANVPVGGIFDADQFAVMFYITKN